MERAKDLLPIPKYPEHVLSRLSLRRNELRDEKIRSALVAVISSEQQMHRHQGYLCASRCCLRSSLLELMFDQRRYYIRICS